MLTFESPFYEIEGVIVFRDHADPAMFHYLAGPPRLTRDEQGNPSLLLLKYRDALDSSGATQKTHDELGGGFLFLGVDCGLSEDKKNTIRNELESLKPSGTGPVVLVPVLYTRGTVSIIALDSQKASAAAPAPVGPPGPFTGPPASTTGTPAAADGHDRFVRGILGTATPSLLQDERAIFSLALSPSAATLIEDAYESELSPIGVMYELEFSGLRPAIAVKAHVDKDRVYDSFRLAFHAGFRSGSSTSKRDDSSGSTSTGTGTTGTAGTTGASVPAGVQPPATSPPSTTPPAVTPPAATPPAATPPAATPPAATPPAATPPAATPPAATPPAATPLPGSPPGGVVRPPLTSPPATTVPGTTPPVTTGQQTPGQGTPQVPSTTSTTEVALSADIGYEVTKLVETEAIKIEIVREQEGASVDDMQRQALDLLKETLISEFFRPAMSNVVAQPIPGPTIPSMPTVPTQPGQPVQPGQPAGAAQPMATTADINRGVAGLSNTKVEIGFQLQIKKQEELGTADYDFSVTAPERRIHAPNGFFSALLTNTQKDKLIRKIDLDDPFFKTIDVDVSTVADFATLDLKVIRVDIQYQGEQPWSATLTPTSAAQPHHFQTFREGDDFTYQYALSYEFGQAETIAAQKSNYSAPSRTEITRALVVNPPDDVSILRVFVEPGVVDWDLIDTIETRLVYDDPGNHFHAEQTFLLKSGSPRQDWLVRLTDPRIATYTVQHRWHLKDHSSIGGDPYVSDVAHLFVPDPYADRLEIQVEALVDREKTAQVDVELEYADPANDLDIRKNVQILGPDFRSPPITIPILDPNRRKFTYRATLIKATGEVEQQAKVQTESPTIRITEGGIPFDVQVIVLGQMDGRIAALQVELRRPPVAASSEHVEALLFEPGGDTRLGARLVLRPDRPQGFEYRTTLFLSDAGPVESDWTEQETSPLVLQPQRLLPV